MKEIKTLLIVSCLAIQSIFAAATPEDPFISLDRIRGELGRYIATAEEARDKNITVFIGNTGVGKSTLINVAAGVPSRVNSDGKIEPENGGGAAFVAPGKESITQYPQHFISPELGDLFDLPGFLDTGGAIANILNASAISSVLTNARTARVIFVTSIQELEAARGKTAKDLGGAASMFEDAFLRSDSCGIIVNSAERETVDNKELSNRKMDLLSGLGHIEEIHNRFLLKKARSTDGAEFLADFRENIVRALSSVNQRPVGKLRMSRTFDHVASSQIKKFFKQCMEKRMNDMAGERVNRIVVEIAENISTGTIEGPVSKVFDKKYSEMWGQFKEEFKVTQEYKFLYAICQGQYDQALEDFEIAFQHDHKGVVSHLKIQEKEEDAKAAREAEKLARASEEKARLEANAAKEQAELRKREKEEAERLEKIARSEAEAAQADATKSKEEKEKAQQEAQRAFEQLNQAKTDFDSFRREYEEKERLSKEEAEKFRKAAADALQKTAELEKAFGERRKEMEKVMASMEGERQQLIKQIAEMEKKHDKDSQAFVAQLNEMKLNHERSMREMAERHAREDAARPRGGGGGGCLIL